MNDHESHYKPLQGWSHMISTFIELHETTPEVKVVGAWTFHHASSRIIIITLFPTLSWVITNNPNLSDHYKACQQPWPSLPTLPTMGRKRGRNDDAAVPPTPVALTAAGRAVATEEALPEVWCYGVEALSSGCCARLAGCSKGHWVVQCILVLLSKG